MDCLNSLACGGFQTQKTIKTWRTVWIDTVDFSCRPFRQTLWHLFLKVDKCRVYVSGLPLCLWHSQGTTAMGCDSIPGPASGPGPGSLWARDIGWMVGRSVFVACGRHTPTHNRFLSNTLEEICTHTNEHASTVCAPWCSSRYTHKQTKAPTQRNLFSLYFLLSITSLFPKNDLDRIHFERGSVLICHPPPWRMVWCQRQGVKEGVRKRGKGVDVKMENMK